MWKLIMNEPNREGWGGNGVMEKLRWRYKNGKKRNCWEEQKNVDNEYLCNS